MGVFASTKVWRPELAIAGLIAGLLTIRPAVPLGADGEVDYLTGGVWFGLLLAAYFFVFQRDRSIGKAISITAVSTAALWIAFWSTLLAYGRFRAPSSGEHAPPVPVVAWFVGGAIGAFIVSTTTFFLYGTSREAVWKKILFCTISGGLLGIAGHEAGTIPMWGALAPQSDTTPPSILFVIWQTGVGFVMGLVWPGTVIEKAAVPPRGLPVPIVAKAFMIVVVAPLAYAVTSTTWFRDQEPQIGAARAAYLAGRPSLNGLPPVAVQSDLAVMINTPIAGHNPARSQYHVWRRFEFPQHVEYAIVYVAPGEPEDTSRPDADVRITQYPTPEWAAYAVRSIEPNGPSASTPRTETIVKFGQRILRAPDRPAARTDVYWVSGPYVVHVAAATRFADEFIRAYLERHPSSL